MIKMDSELKKERCPAAIKGYYLDDEEIITEYLDAHLEGGIKQKNLDCILDLMDEYVELLESLTNQETISKSI